MSILLALLLAAADVPRLQPAEVHARMQSGDAVVVDVRGTVPYELGHIRGAVWMPLGVMPQRADELPREKLIVAYCTCKAEETSLEAARLLSNRGFEHVAVLQGGYPAWKDAGLPTESNREQPVTTAAGRLAPPAAMRLQGRSDRVRRSGDPLSPPAGENRARHRHDGRHARDGHASPSRQR